MSARALTGCTFWLRSETSTHPIPGTYRPPAASRPTPTAPPELLSRHASSGTGHTRAAMASCDQGNGQVTRGNNTTNPHVSRRSCSSPIRLRARYRALWLRCARACPCAHVHVRACPCAHVHVRERVRTRAFEHFGKAHRMERQCSKLLVGCTCLPSHGTACLGAQEVLIRDRCLEPVERRSSTGKGRVVGWVMKMRWGGARTRVRAKVGQVEGGSVCARASTLHLRLMRTCANAQAHTQIEAHGTLARTHTKRPCSHHTKHQQSTTHGSAGHQKSSVPKGSSTVAVHIGKRLAEVLSCIACEGAQPPSAGWLPEEDDAAR